MNPLLRIDELNVRFQCQGSSLHAVRGISYDLHEEETIGIVGESGCGKTASAKALIRLLPSHNTSIEGTISYRGQNLLALSEKQMQRVRGKEIGMIFQDPMTALNPTMKIGEQIVEGIRRHFPELSRKERRTKAIEMLEKVGIPSPEMRFEAYPHTLSGGLRQRVMIALCLVCNPCLLIADEVTTALDVTIQAQILDLLQQMKNEMKMSVLLITHDMSVVAKFCDRVLVMYAGKIVEDAPVLQLFSNPQHPYTQRLLQAIPRLDQPKTHRLPAIKGSPPNLSIPITGCSFCPRCGSAMPICALKCPPLLQVGQDHHAACFLYEAKKG